MVVDAGAGWVREGVAVSIDRVKSMSREELAELIYRLPSCPGIEVEHGNYSGCTGGPDCPTCEGKWPTDPNSNGTTLYPLPEGIEAPANAVKFNGRPHVPLNTYRFLVRHDG